MSSPFLRIVMAMYLAIWSPAVCCCGLKTAMGCVTGVEVARCGERPSASGDLAASPTNAALPGCCAQREAINSSLSAVSPQSEVSPSGETPPCRCHETIENTVRLDTGAKTSLPALVKSDLSLIVQATFVVCVDQSLPPAIARSDQAQRAEPPPLTTLHAQRCLLLL